MAELQVLQVFAQFAQAGFLLQQRGVELFFLLLNSGLVGVLAFPQQLDFTLDDINLALAQFRSVFQGLQIASQAQQLLLKRLIVGAQLLKPTLERLQLLDMVLQRLKFGVALGDGLFDRLVQPGGLSGLILLPQVPEIAAAAAGA